MKQLCMKLFLVWGSVLLGGTALQAQTYSMKADVPFAFHVKNVELAAGKYLITRNGSLPLDLIENSRGVKATIMAVGALDNKGTPRLVFHRYGDEFFLAEIWNTAGSGYKVPLSKREREARERPEGKDVATITVDVTVAP
jgi:hypothetical protein